MNKIQGVPEDIQEIISYLSEVFSRSINDSVNSKEDLSQDLYVCYFENIDGKGKVKEVKNKNHWFILFKSYLLNKYKRVMMEKNIFEKISEEVANYYGKTKIKE